MTSIVRPSCLSATLRNQFSQSGHYLFRLPLFFPVGGKSDGPPCLLLFWLNAAQLLRYLRQWYCHLPILFWESESSKLTVVLDGIFSIGIIRKLPCLTSMTQISALCHGFLIAVYQPL